MWVSAAAAVGTVPTVAATVDFPRHRQIAGGHPRVSTAWTTMTGSAMPAPLSLGASLTSRGVVAYDDCLLPPPPPPCMNPESIVNPQLPMTERTYMFIHNHTHTAMLLSPSL